MEPNRLGQSIRNCNFLMVTNKHSKSEKYPNQFQPPDKVPQLTNEKREPRSRNQSNSKVHQINSSNHAKRSAQNKQKSKFKASPILRSKTLDILNQNLNKQKTNDRIKETSSKQGRTFEELDDKFFGGLRGLGFFAG